MRRTLQLVLFAVLFAATAIAGEVLDRVVAIVNNTPIFQSDWEMALRVEALLDARNPESFTPAEQRSVFERLVDQELLREQMRGFAVNPVTDDDVNARIQEIRSQIAGGKSDESWKQDLAQAGLSEQELRSRVRLQLEILRFLDNRFRPIVRVEFRTIQQYYRDQFLPELHKRGGSDVPLSEAAPKIREILTQQRMDEQITSWLQTLREQADIRVPGAKSNRELVENK
jgi:parvulin-like peptidyl-prolyl isomerase